MHIIGAGMAGLLAAHMLRRHRPHVLEAQPSLPNNHNALLRFRTDSVSRATGIPFKRVWVTKGIVDDSGKLFGQGESTLQASNLYSFKVTGELLPRSIMDLTPAERWIAPSNFIMQLADGLDIQFEAPWHAPDLWSRNESGDDPVISTIPMPKLMDMALWQKDRTPEFSWRPVWTTRGLIIRPKADLYQSLYYPSFNVPWYRISITGHEVIAESMIQTGDAEMLGFLERTIMANFGLPSSTIINWSGEHKQEYGKLAPADDRLRRAFILAMTDRYRIYSLGRFATWRQILLDDIVHDVEVIEKFITERDMYARNLAQVGR